MERRPLGRSGLHVSPLAFGGNVFGWTADEATSHSLLDAWIDAGGNLVDTADQYSAWVPGNVGGESEAIIGRWLARRGRRDDIVIATKVGKLPGRTGLAPANIRRQVDESLRRLRTDHIDLYQSHAPDPATPIEETLETYAGLVRAGKVRAIGASNYGAEALEAALAASDRGGWPRYESLQPLYNLVERRGYESELEPVCARHGLGVIPFYALASGFLSGKYRSAADLAQSPRGAAAGKYLNEGGLGVLAALDAVGARVGAAPATVALAWQIARPSITSCIVSATTLAQLKELVAAATLRLDDEAMRRIDEASGGGGKAGAA